MNGDALQRFAPGQGLGTLRADTMNALVDAAKIVRAKMSKGQTGGRFQPLRQGPGSLEVLIRNDTGATLSERSVVELTTPLADPLVYGLDNQERPAFAADAPTGATSSIAVTVDPLGDGDFGRAVVLGVAVADLSVVDAGHEFCGPTATETGFLTTASTGPIRILWRESGTGNKLGIVLLQDWSTPAPPKDPYGGFTYSNLHTSASTSFPSGYTEASQLSGTNLPSVTDTVRVTMATPGATGGRLAAVMVSCHANLFAGTVSGATYGFFVVKAGVSSATADVMCIPYPGRSGAGDEPVYGAATLCLPAVQTHQAGLSYIDVTVSYTVRWYSAVTWGGATAPAMRLRTCTGALAIANPEVVHNAFTGDWFPLPLGFRGDGVAAACPSVATI
jgi:hypothetical protein